MSNVFISYARNDADTVLPFAARLRGDGFEVWLDQKSITAAVPWREEIVKAIRSSDLVVVMQSPSWQKSSNCADELGAAMDHDKAIVYVDITDSTTSWLEEVKYADSKIRPDDRTLSALLGASYRWQRAGKTTAHLASGSTLRSYRAVAHRSADGFARKFIRASIRRSYLLQGAVAATVAVIVYSIIGYMGVARSASALEQEVASFQAEQEIARAVQHGLTRSPGSGLQAAIEFAETGESSGLQAGLALALMEHVPSAVDDAPEGTPNPAPVMPVGAEVIHEDTRLTVVPGGLRVDVDDWKIFRPLGDSVTSVAWSEDGSKIAAATNSGVHIIRVSTGREVAVLRGFDGAIEQLRWDGPAAVIGELDETVVTWSLDQSTVSAHLGWPMLALVTGSSDDALAVGNEGQLAIIAGGKERGLPSIENADSSFVAAKSTTAGWLVATSDADSTGTLTAVTSNGEVDGGISIGDCDPVALDSVEASTVFVGCAFSDVVLVDLTSGTAKRIPVTEFQLTNLLIDVDGTLIATSVNAEFFVWSDSKWALAGDYLSGCWQGASVMASSPDGDQILTSGSGAMGCTQLRYSPADRSDFDSVLVPANLKTIRAVDWSPSGTHFAAVAESGELWIYDEENEVTTAVTVPTGANLRSVAFVDESTVLVGTIDGELVTVDVNIATAGRSEQLAEARRRLELAIAAGLD